MGGWIENVRKINEATDVRHTQAVTYITVDWNTQKLINDVQATLGRRQMQPVTCIQATHV